VLAYFYTAVLLIAVTGGRRIRPRRVRNPIFDETRACGLWAYFSISLHYLCIEFFRFLAIRHGEPRKLFLSEAQLLGVALAIAVCRHSWALVREPLLRKGHGYRY